MHLGRRMVRTEVVRVRVDPPLPKRLELFPPDHDLLVVFGHAAEVSETECVYWLPGGGSNNMIWGPVQCSGAARPARFRCPQTPSASSSAPALGLPGAPSGARALRALRASDAPRPTPARLHRAQLERSRARAPSWWRWRSSCAGKRHFGSGSGCSRRGPMGRQTSTPRYPRARSCWDPPRLQRRPASIPSSWHRWCRRWWWSRRRCRRAERLVRSARRKCP